MANIAAIVKELQQERDRLLRPDEPLAPAPVRMMSQAARNKIAAAQRARWAKTRALQKKAA